MFIYKFLSKAYPPDLLAEAHSGEHDDDLRAGGEQDANIEIAITIKPVPLYFPLAIIRFNRACDSVF